MGTFGRSDDNVDDGGLRHRVDALERRVAALEWALRSAAGRAAEPRSAGAAAAESVSAEVRQLAMLGKKIDAIKVLRAETGLSLQECKDIIDRLTP